MAVLRSLVTTIGLNSSQYRAELKRSTNSTQHWAASTKKQAKEVEKGFSSTGMAANALKGQMSNLTAGLAGALAVGSVTAYMSATMDAMDQTQKFSDRINISSDALQELRYAAGQCGVEQNNLDTSLQRMTRRVSEAAAGTGAAKSAIEELGLSAQKLHEMRPDQQLKAIADAMTDVKNEQDKTRLSMNLFDTDGVGMINLLREGSEGITEMQVRARQLGRVISRDMLNNVADANDAMDDLGSAAWEAGYIMTAHMAPGITTVARALTELFNGEGHNPADAIYSALDKTNAAIDAKKKQIEEVQRMSAGDLYKANSGGYGLYSPEGVAEQRNKKLEALNQELERLVKQSKNLESQLSASNDGDGGTSDIPQKPSLDAPPGGLTEEQLKLQTERSAAWITQLEQRLLAGEALIHDRYDEDRARAMQEIEDAEQQGQILKLIEENREKEITELKKREIEERKRYQQAAAMSTLNFATQQLSMTTNMLRTAGKEQSGIYKALFAAQKLAAIPAMIISTEEAYTKTLAAFPQTPWVAEGVRGMGYASVGIAAGQAISGFRADGGEVGYGQTYVVGERGPELFTPGASGQITSHENLQKAVGQRSGRNQSSEIQQITFAPQITVEAGAGQETDTRRAEEISDMTYERIHEDITTGGPIHTAIFGA